MTNTNLHAENEGLSGFRELLGFTVTEWSPGRVVIDAPVLAHHLNRNGFVHGGVLTSLLDSASGLCGTFCPVPGNIRRCGTVSLATQFMSPVQDGVLRVVARQLSRGRKIFFTDAQVHCGDTLVATAQGSFRYILGGDNEEGVPASQ
ncbi:PaaI family thioesterase [Marinobacter sp. X15-166B]|uniref:PaaI family thioesterase n=1 Tax=Marinobacter sp. X15-166B TaxID=1897620 RepID=UPI00085CAB0C|nr:PaaI family thioesterase [Marinobacter sp. X15-166B]OEY66381.1 aromatic compounds catabolism protein [Marinobacter sp. X15-166B]